MTPAMYFGIRYAIDLVARDESLAGLLHHRDRATCSSPAATSAATTATAGPISPPCSAWTTRRSTRVRLSPKPVVCAVNGSAQGGGLMIAMLADVAVASERATFRAPELFRGIADTNYAPDPAPPDRPRPRPRHADDRAAVTAAEALDWGLVARVVPHDQLMTEALDALAWCCRTRARARPPSSRSSTLLRPPTTAWRWTPASPSTESVEGFIAFKERRNPSWVPPDLRTDGRL